MSEKHPRQNTGNHPDPLADLRDAARDLCDVLHDMQSEEHFDGHHDDECPLCDAYERVRAALEQG